MPLSDDRIKALLAKKNAPRQTGVRTGTRKKINPEDRSYQAWFALHHHLYIEATGEPAYCENEDCIDPRDRTRGQSVVDLNGKLMCRYCFLEGWLLVNAGQQEI